jgi:trimeric autotransporter adhesin
VAAATVTVTKPVSGESLTAVTDASGDWSFLHLRRGVYLVRVEKEGYSPLVRQENVSSANQELDGSLIPIAEGAPPIIGGRALAALWPPLQIPPPSSSGLNFNLSIQQQTAAAIGHASVSIPSFAGDPYFSDDSFFVNGQANTIIPYLVGSSIMESDFENGPEMQDPAEYAAQFSNMFGSGPAGGGFGALIKTSPVRPHGVLFWNGGNSVLNARPFVITGQPDPNPSYNSNSYGGVLAGRPMLPGLPQSKRDFVLLSYLGVMSRSLVNSYGVVPTTLERQGNFSQLVGPTGQQVPIYPPQETKVPYPNNIIDTPLDPVALALIPFIPEPNLSGSTLNYHLLTTQGIHQNSVGARYNHSFGAAPAAIPGLVSNTGGLTQSFGLNFTFNHQAADLVNLFPQLGRGGKFQLRYSSSGLRQLYL